MCKVLMEIFTVPQKAQIIPAAILEGPASEK